VDLVLDPEQELARRRAGGVVAGEQAHERLERGERAELAQERLARLARQLLRALDEREELAVGVRVIRPVPPARDVEARKPCGEEVLEGGEDQPVQTGKRMRPLRLAA